MKTDSTPTPQPTAATDPGGFNVDLALKNAGITSTNGKGLVPIFETRSPVGEQATRALAAKLQAQPAQGGRVLYSADYASSHFLDMSAEDQKRFRDAALAAGFIKPGDDAQKVWAAWDQAVRSASAYNGQQSSPASYLSPFEVLGRLSASQLALNGKTATSTTTTDVTHNIFDASNSEGTIKTAFQQALGRDPSREEVSQYAKVLQAAYDANPSTRTTSTDANGNSTSTYSGGIDQASVIQDQVQKSPEWGTYQGATTYFNVAMQALGATA